jgi:hypothetical protein
LVKLSILFTLFSSEKLDKKMKVSLLISTIGVIIFSLGIIFHLQGQAIVGPQSSFMYANPSWITYGIQIAVFGGIITGVGIGIKFLRGI